MKVYLLQGGYDYHSDTVLQAYAKREDAERDLTACLDHRGMRPRLSGGFIHDMPEEEVSAYWNADQAWRALLLFGSDYDTYCITEHEVQP